MVPYRLQEQFNGFSRGKYPIAEDLCNNHICLPIYPQMNNIGANYVLKQLKEVLQWDITIIDGEIIIYNTDVPNPFYLSSLYNIIFNYCLKFFY